MVREGRLVGGGQRHAGVQAQAEDERLGGRGVGVERLAVPPGGSRPVGQRRDVAVQARGVPAPGHAIEGVRAGPDRLVRPALPVGQVVPALVPGPRPVRDLVAAEPGVGQGHDGVVVLGRGAVLVLPGADAARASGARPCVVGRWSPSGAGQALGIGVVEGSA